MENNIETLPDYKPLSKEQHAKINDLWSMYKSGVRLDYNLILEFRSQGVADDKMADAIKVYRESTKGDLEAWQSLRKRD